MTTGPDDTEEAALPEDRIYLNAFDMGCVVHQAPGLWAHPEDQAYRYKDLDYWTDLAKLLEGGGFDSLFLADVLGVYDVYQGSSDAAVRDAVQVPVNEPSLAIPAMAAVTEHLGFGVTVSLTYEHPYAFARRMSTLDHLTNGRVAWNIVTSYLESAARNLGLKRQVPHDERYELAEEYLEICYKLWEGSWEDDAVLRDRERRVFADPAKVHPIGHAGEYFDVPGIHLSEPSPQRTPVLYQAGASPRGRAFAAKHAECIFTNAYDPAVVRQYVDDTRRLAAEEGRDPTNLKFFSMLTPIVAASDEGAQKKYEEYVSYVSYDGALALFSGWSGLDMSEYRPDQPLEYVENDAMRSAVHAFTKADPSRKWTPKDIAEFVGIGGRGPVAVGSPKKIADEMERWVDEAGVDGFNLAYVTTPGTFEDFVEHVVPELRRRGRVRTDYGGSTLRENIYGPGVKRLQGDHPGSEHRRVRTAAE